MINKRNLSLLVVVFVSTLLILVDYFTIRTTSAVRAYTNGESRYSKGQKDGSKHLIMYISSGNPKYWDYFLRELKVPLGDSAARVGLMNNGEEAAIKDGFLQGENHSDDLDNMIWLFQNFKDVSFMKRAIQIWKQADVKIGKLVLLGGDVRRKMVAGGFSLQEKEMVMQEVDKLTMELTTMEREFSDVLGSAAREINIYLFVLNIFLTLLIIGSAGSFSMIMIRKLRASNERSKETLQALLLSEQRLKEILNRFEKLSDNIPGFIYEFCMRPDGSTYFPFASKGVREIYGLSPSEISEDAMPLFDRMHPDDRERVGREIEQAARTLSGRVSEFRIHTPGGKTKWMRTQASIEPQKDGSFLWYGYTFEITELKKAMIVLEELLKEKEELISVKDKFFSIVSHDLKSPVNTLHSFILLIEKCIDDLSKEEIKKMVNEINKAFQGTKALMDDLTTWAQSRMNGNGTTPENIDLRKNIDAMISLAMESSAVKQIAISYSGPNVLPVYADSYQVDFIIRNLLSNAIKFTPRGGGIDISARTDNGSIKLSIQDSGIGISPADLKNLFQMGRVRSTKGTEGEKGTGLGLGLVKEFIEKNAGEIAVESTKGKGTIFHVTLPRGASFGDRIIGD